MRELNLGSIGYLTFRLAPFILVSFFVLSSMFRQDIKGLIYVVGLIIAGFCNGRWKFISTRIYKNGRRCSHV